MGLAGLPPGLTPDLDDPDLDGDLESGPDSDLLNALAGDLLREVLAGSEPYLLNGLAGDLLREVLTVSDSDLLNGLAGDLLREARAGSDPYLVNGFTEDLLRAGSDLFDDGLELDSESDLANDLIGDLLRKAPPDLTVFLDGEDDALFPNTWANFPVDYEMNDLLSYKYIGFLMG